MNKTILITGAAKRIGKEMALSFFNKGWDIVIHYNGSKGEAEALADKMNSERSDSAMQMKLQNW
jgi:pteridine reductase